MSSLGKPLITPQFSHQKPRVIAMLNPAGGSQMHLNLPLREEVWDIVRAVVSGPLSL